MQNDETMAGFYAPVRRSLIEPILLAGTPRSVAILNGTLAAAIGLGLRLWLFGAAFWFVCQLAAVWATRKDADFLDVTRRHLRYPAHMVA